MAIVMMDSWAFCRGREVAASVAERSGYRQVEEDGVLQAAEMPSRTRQAFESGQLDPFNADVDDGLSPAEYRQFVEHRRRQRAEQQASAPRN